MLEVFYKMYRGAGIHFHSTTCWFSVLVDVIASSCFVGTCCKQLKKKLLPQSGAAKGQQKQWSHRLCPRQVSLTQVSKDWLWNSALQHYKKLLNRSNFLCSSSVLRKFRHFLVFSSPAAVCGCWAIPNYPCYCFLSKGHWSKKETSLNHQCSKSCLSRLSHCYLTWNEQK